MRIVVIFIIEYSVLFVNIKKQMQKINFIFDERGDGFYSDFSQRNCPVIQKSTFVCKQKCFFVGAVSDDKSEPNASSISAKVIVFVPSL